MHDMYYRETSIQREREKTMDSFRCCVEVRMFIFDTIGPTIQS